MYTNVVDLYTSKCMVSKIIYNTCLYLYAHSKVIQSSCNPSFNVKNTYTGRFPVNL